jgi:hypothetical protein
MPQQVGERGEKQEQTSPPAPLHFVERGEKQELFEAIFTHLKNYPL